MKRLFARLFLMLTLVFITACDRSDVVNNNLRNQEGNFKIYRQVMVINLRSDKILLEVEGYLNIYIDSDGDLNITIKIAEDAYQLHYVSLSGEVVYISRQLENAHTNPYYWEIRIFAIVPEITIG